MQLELKDEKGVMGAIELPLEKLKEELSLGNSSSEIAAHLKESLGLGSGSVASPAQHDTGAGWNPDSSLSYRCYAGGKL